MAVKPKEAVKKKIKKPEGSKETKSPMRWKPEELPRVKDNIKEAITVMSGQCPSENKEHYEKLLNQIYVDGLLPYKVMKIDDNAMEYMYTLAYNLYQSGNLQDAREWFLYLLKLNPNSNKYNFALGCCYKKMQKWPEAAVTFLRCYIISDVDPMPLYHAADCMIENKSKEAAILLLKQALADTHVLENIRGPMSPQNEALKQRAKMLIDSLEKGALKKDENKAADNK